MSRVAVIGSTAFSAVDFIDYLLEDPTMNVLGISRSAESEPVFMPHHRHGFERYAFKQLHLVDQMDDVIAALDEFRPEYVVNFAAQGEVRSSFEQPVAHFETNTLAMVKLTEALRTRDYLVKYVHISTPEVYGACPFPVKEDQPMDPSSPYAASKGASDLFTSVLYKVHEFPVVWIRSTNVYGPHQQLYRIIPRTAIYMKLGRKLTLDGGGVAIKSYIHIRDISRGEKLAMLNGEPGKVYHFSPDEGVSVRRVVETVCSGMGYEFDKHVEVGPERPGQDAAYYLDSTRARTELGWAPEIGFDEGAQSCVDWIERDWDRIKDLPLDYEFRR